MAKSSKFGPRTPGTVLAMRLSKNGSCFIGMPNRMFSFNSGVSSERRRVCLLYGITDKTLTKLVTDAYQHLDELVLMTL